MNHHPQFKDWIKDYEQIRGNLDFWPRHQPPTINTYRYSVYQDRIDYLLFDLKSYFKGLDTPMKKSYENKTTLIWLKQFDNDFEKFINKMGFKAFVNNDYDVLNIESGQKEIISHFPLGDQIKQTIDKYLNQLLELNKKGKFNNL